VISGSTPGTPDDGGIPIAESGSYLLYRQPLGERCLLSALELLLVCEFLGSIHSERAQDSDQVGAER
jgi:hypothetical protein